jgi:hypothetical protein
MAHKNDGPRTPPQGLLACNAVTPTESPQGDDGGVTELPPTENGVETTAAPRSSKPVNPGLTRRVSTVTLQAGARLRALSMVNRFRVARTIDVAVCCYADRPYKAALTAAQRAVRGMVKAGMLRRYRTDRFQTIYGLTAGGAQWLEEHEVDATSSVRRVSDMSNPEHRLWAQFIVLSAEVRGLRAMTEGELLQSLNHGKKPGDALVQGLLKVETSSGKRAVTRLLRPDALLEESDGATWVEIDRSKRGADREASLAALVRSVGVTMTDGKVLRRIVIWCKSERIEKRALAVMRAVARADNPEVLLGRRRHLREVEPQQWEVQAGVSRPQPDGRVGIVDERVGHVVVQRLPIWLPRVRVDARNQFSMAGWFSENYLPYRRPPGPSSWPALTEGAALLRPRP